MNARPEVTDSPTRVLLDLLYAIGEARDEDPTELTPIGTLLDPDALGRFVASTSVPTTITLGLYDCQVEIDTDGSITVSQ